MTTISLSVSGKNKSAVVVVPLPPLRNTKTTDVLNVYKIEYTNRGLISLVPGVNGFTFPVHFKNMDDWEHVTKIACPALEVARLKYEIEIVSSMRSDSITIGIRIPSLTTGIMEIHSNSIFCIVTENTKLILI